MPSEPVLARLPSTEPVAEPPVVEPADVEPVEPVLPEPPVDWPSGSLPPEEVPGELVRAVGLVGDPDAARERLRAYGDAGADLTVVYPVVVGADPGASLTPTILALAPDKDP